MARTKTTGRIYQSKALSIDPKLLLEAEERARALGMNFSDYVRRVIIFDLQRGGSIKIDPMPGTAAPSAAMMGLKKKRGKS
jgi:hypothetical protein